jgi:protein disulfide-isomerase A6
VNADEHKGLGGQYGVQGFPTIKFFGEDKYKPQDYQSKFDEKSTFSTFFLINK